MAKMTCPKRGRIKGWEKRIDEKSWVIWESVQGAKVTVGRHNNQWGVFAQGRWLTIGETGGLTPTKKSAIRGARNYMCKIPGG